MRKPFSILERNIMYSKREVVEIIIAMIIVYVSMAYVIIPTFFEPKESNQTENISVNSQNARLNTCLEAQEACIRARIACMKEDPSCKKEAEICNKAAERCNSQ